VYIPPAPFIFSQVDLAAAADKIAHSTDDSRERAGTFCVDQIAAEPNMSTLAVTFQFLSDGASLGCEMSPTVAVYKVRPRPSLRLVLIDVLTRDSANQRLAPETAMPSPSQSPQFFFSGRSNELKRTCPSAVSLTLALQTAHFTSSSGEAADAMDAAINVGTGPKAQFGFSPPLVTLLSVTWGDADVTTCVVRM
jgi:hypothetical protein